MKTKKITKIYLWLICFALTALLHTSIVSASSVSKSYLACESKIKNCNKALNKYNEINLLLKKYEESDINKEELIELLQEKKSDISNKNFSKKNEKTDLYKDEETLITYYIDIIEEEKSTKLEINKIKQKMEMIIKTKDDEIEDDEIEDDEIEDNINDIKKELIKLKKLTRRDDLPYKKLQNNYENLLNKLKTLPIERNTTLEIISIMHSIISLENIEIFKVTPEDEKKFFEKIFRIIEGLILDLKNNYNEDLLDKTGLESISKILGTKIKNYYSTKNKTDPNIKQRKHILLHMVENISYYNYTIFNPESYKTLASGTPVNNFKIKIENNYFYIQKRKKENFLAFFQNYTTSLTTSYNNKYIVPHIAIFTDEKNVYTVSKSSKQDLRDYLKNKEKPIREKINLIKHIITAVKSMHNKYLKHGNLKPEKILIESGENNEIINMAIIQNNNNNSNSYSYTPAYHPCRNRTNYLQNNIISTVNMIWEIFNKDNYITLNEILYDLNNKDNTIKLAEWLSKQKSYRPLLTKNKDYIKKTYFPKMEQKVYDALIKFTLAVMPDNDNEIFKLNMNNLEKQFNQFAESA